MQTQLIVLGKRARLSELSHHCIDRVSPVRAAGMEPAWQVSLN